MFKVVAAPREDGALSIVEAWETGCVLSNGDELLVRWGKLAELCRQLCQDQAPITGVRVWPSLDGIELVEIHNADGYGGVSLEPKASSKESLGIEVF